MGVCVQEFFLFFLLIPPFFFLFFLRKEMKASQQSASIKERKSLGKVPHITKHDLLKQNVRLLLCLRWVIGAQQRVKELNDMRILTERAPPLNLID